MNEQYFNRDALIAMQKHSEGWARAAWEVTQLAWHTRDGDEFAVGGHVWDRDRLLEFADRLGEESGHAAAVVRRMLEFPADMSMGVHLVPIPTPNVCRGTNGGAEWGLIDFVLGHVADWIVRMPTGRPIRYGLHS